MTHTYDNSYEVDFDGELGSLLSVDAHGHLDYEEAELFLADTVARELYEAGYEDSPSFGVEIEHLWRSEYALSPDDDEADRAERWAFHYTVEGRNGAVAVTRFRIASPWSRAAVAANAPRAERDRRTREFVDEGVDEWPLICVKHPDEPAVAGIPEDRFLDLEPGLALDGNVHYCDPCRSDFLTRLSIATEKAWAPERAAAFLKATTEEDDVIARAFTHWFYRSDLDRVLRGDDEDGSSRRALTAFVEAYNVAQGPRTIATAQPGFGFITVTDLRHLLEDYVNA